MKCTTCGADIPDGATQCPECGAFPEAAVQSPETNMEQPTQEMSTPPPARKKAGKLIPAILIGLVVICGAAFAAVKLTAKDPKQVVIDAFENIIPDDQISPSEELFGLKEFGTYSLTADQEAGMTLTLDSCSDETVSAYSGSGLRIEAKEDQTNQKTGINVGVIFNGMDLANLNAYYGDQMLMLAVPELSSKVFTANLGDGLAERLKNSPTLAPVLLEAGVDVDGLAQYITDLKAQAESMEEGEMPFDLQSLIDRYKEGSKAQDNFKAALTVTKGQKSKFTMDGKEASCRGYQVVVSKASMIDFLRSSSDFFLNDQTLKEDFLKQLETSVKLSGLMGSAITGQGSLSAQEQQDQLYTEAETSVTEMITYLDETLTDVQMNVYVDKKGRLASVDGTTVLLVTDEATGEKSNIDVAFRFNLEGGTYLTQNLNGNITLTDATDTVTANLTKQGTYDGNQLTCDIAADISLPGAEAYNFTYTGTYQKDDGSYHIGMDAGNSTLPMVTFSMSGDVDQLEKGKSFHMNLDSMEVTAPGLTMAFSGEYYCLPLSSEVTPLEGDQLDMLEATTDDWNSVVMEAFSNIISMSGQLN